LDRGPASWLFTQSGRKGNGVVVHRYVIDQPRRRERNLNRKNLRTIRKWRGLSQTEVADRTGITRGRVSAIELGASTG
jgi:DNA-binding transcriptional regulator YiaG